MHKQDDFLETETGDGIYEIQMAIRRVVDDKPFHLGISILQHSKESVYIILINKIFKIFKAYHRTIKSFHFYDSSNL